MGSQTVILLSLPLLPRLLCRDLFIFKKDYETEEENIEADIFSISFLKEKIRCLFNEITNQNITSIPK